MRKLALSELQRLSVEEFKASQKFPVVLILDNIRSALNVGSAFRTADAFALEQIALCGITATPPHREILKTAIGASHAVEWTYYASTIEAIEALRAQNYRIIGVEQTDESVSLASFSIVPDAKYALVFGNEVQGLANEVLPHLDACVEVPQFGTKHSLNVAVCIGVVLWEFCRRFIRLQSPLHDRDSQK